MEKNKNENDSTVAHGEMPSLAKDNYGNLHIVYGSGDSLMYSFSSNNGKSFSSPELISILPHLVSSHMRGPQVAQP